MAEHALVFRCRGEQLCGILHEPTELHGDRGVVIVVGGPQYRVGSHRQFVLLARALAAHGVPVLRFDHRGVGDSDGDTHDFTRIADDIDAAVATLLDRVPALRAAIIWGLCDAASAAMMFAHRNPRVAGLVLLNPWARNPELQARAVVRTYYARRLLDPAFWRGLLSGRVRLGRSLRELAGHATLAAGARPGTQASFLVDMRTGLTAFSGPVLLILSGDDLTASEFRELARSSSDWRALLAAPRVRTHELAAANHTFSRAEWRDQVARWTAEWLRS